MNNNSKQENQGKQSNKKTNVGTKEKDWGIKEWIGWTLLMLFLCVVIALLQEHQPGAMNFNTVMNDAGRLFGIILIPFLVVLGIGVTLIFILKLLSKKWFWVCIGILLLSWVASRINYIWLIIIMLFLGLAQQEDRIRELEKEKNNYEK